MEAISSVFDKLKGFTKASQDFVEGLIHRRENSRRRNPIEILKRLQREAFSDLMKLRDRQDKVEKLLSFYKPSKGSPFHEATTLVRGHVDLLGALLVMCSIDQENIDAINRAGIRTGIDSRIIFETTIREKDNLVADFMATHKGMEHPGDVPGRPLSLAKLSYIANISDWLSLMAIPIGAQCRDVGIASKFSPPGKGLTDVSSFGPPLLNLHNGGGVGVILRQSKVVASLAQFFSGQGMQSGSNTMENWSGTFGQLVCQFTRGAKLSLLGLHQMPLSSSQLTNLGPHSLSILLSKRREASETVPESLLGTRTQVSTGSIALMVEWELDDITRIGGWIEMTKLNPKSLQWAVNMSEDPEDSFGWGLSLSGMHGDSARGYHFQAESYLKFDLGNRFSLNPGLAYIMDRNSNTAALMLRSYWSL